MFALLSAVGQSGVIQPQKIRGHLFLRLTKAQLHCFSLKLVCTHAHVHKASTVLIFLTLLPHFFPTSKNLSGKCDCKIIILVYTQPGSPSLIFMILWFWKIKQKENRHHSSSSNPLVSTFNVTVNVDLTQQAWVKGFTDTEPEVH